jgi:hypothetical protein
MNRQVTDPFDPFDELLLVSALVSGPGTVFCDYLCYIFMFLSVATSNMVATSLANKVRAARARSFNMVEPQGSVAVDAWAIV